VNEDPGTEDASPGAPAPGRAHSKKEQILGLFAAGIQDVQEIAALAQARPSYVAAILKAAGHLDSYYDLYTSSDAMNIYAKHFRGKVGFRDAATARASTVFMGNLYEQFGAVRDRAGQHHVLLEALTMYDRARWIGKREEAAIFARFLIEKLTPGARSVERAGRDG
jgi:hypothetical protein